MDTRWGPLTVTVSGARGGTPCLTFHDVGLSHRSCFQGLLLALGPKSLLLRNYTLYHVDAPGCQVRPATHVKVGACRPRSRLASKTCCGGVLAGLADRASSGAALCSADCSLAGLLLCHPLTCRQLVLRCPQPSCRCHWAGWQMRSQMWRRTSS